MEESDGRVKMQDQNVCLVLVVVTFRKRKKDLILVPKPN